MKKLKWLILVMCLVLGLSVFAACGGKDDKGTDNTVKVTSITLAPTRAMEIGKSTVLTASIEPFEADAPITWKTSDKAVVTVSTEGQNYGSAKITAVAAGEATVTATASGKTATCVVTVTEHIIPYYFIAGQSSAAYFNWDNYYREIIDLEAPRLLTPVDGSNEKVFTTTIDLFEGDMLKICQVIDDSTKDEHWKKQVGGSEEEGVTEADLKLSGAEDKTVLPNSGWTSGNPPAFSVTAEGKYELTLDLTGEKPEISYKKVGTTDPVAWSYTVGFHGWWDGETNDNGEQVWYGIDFGTATFDKTHLTATADVELKVAPFGVKTMANGSQVGWFNSDKMELADGVTTITLNAGSNADCTAAGTYNVTITMNEDGSIAKILFNSYTAPAAE